MTKRIFRALMITAMTIISTTIAEARPVDGEALLKLDGSLDRARRTKAIVGSWLNTVNVTGGPTFDSLSTYTNDGGWMFNDQISVVTEGPSPRVLGPGHGVWVHQGGRHFSLTSLQLISDLKGDLVARHKFRQTLTLDRSTDAYRAVWKSEFTDPAGNVIATFEGTTKGRRIRAEPLP